MIFQDRRGENQSNLGSGGASLLPFSPALKKLGKEQCGLVVEL